MNNLLNMLRHETRPVHQALHRHPFMKKCLDEGLDISEYRILLHVFSIPSTWLINNLDLIQPTELRDALITRHESLLSDLEKLDELKEYDEAFVPVAAIQNFKSDEVLGVMYSVVGSSLGASQLRSAITKHLPDVPVKYLSQSPHASGWPPLVRLLRSNIPEDSSGTIQGAIKVFQCISESLPISRRSSRGLIINADKRSIEA